MEILFIKGALIGFSIAAPVGPIGMLCIKRSLTEGQRSGLVSGIGAATADALYRIIAALGLTAITGFIIGQQFLLQLILGLIFNLSGLQDFHFGASNSFRTSSTDIFEKCLCDYLYPHSN